MASTLSPLTASPTLSHGSSSFDEIDNWLDLPKSQDSNTPQQHNNFDAGISIQDGTSNNFSGLDMGEFFRQYMASDKPQQGFTEPIDFSSASMFPSVSSFDQGNALTSFDPSLSIDPLLVDSTASPSAFSAYAPTTSSNADVDMSQEHEEEDEEELFAEPEPEAQPKGKGKGRANRSTRSAKAAKPSVADLVLPGTSIASHAKPTIAHADGEASGSSHKLPHIVFPVPDYVDRPSAEDYKKMSSKEKRQMRNKISARNFRHRRKEYITTLEEEIATRDTTISTLQEEMSSLRTENSSLRTDMDALKATFEQLMQKHLPSTPSENISPRPRSPMVKPNFAKDRSANFGPGGVSGLTSNLGVHTTLIPSPASIFLQKNMNPKLNAPLDPSHTAHLTASNDSFFSSNPYTLFGQSNNQSHLDRYRGQLYGKLAHNINGSKLSAEEKAAFRPSYFSSPSPTDESVKREVEDVVGAQTAYVAEKAKQTLVAGLWNHFWSAFSASDVNVADLLSGRSKMQVVPVQQAKVEELSDAVDAMTLAAPGSPTREGFGFNEWRKA